MLSELNDLDFKLTENKCFKSNISYAVRSSIIIIKIIDRIRNLIRQSVSRLWNEKPAPSECPEEPILTI